MSIAVTGRRSRRLPPVLIPSETAAHFLGVARKTLIQYAKAGKIRFSRPPQHEGAGKAPTWRFSVLDILHFMRAHQYSEGAIDLFCQAAGIHPDGTLKDGQFPLPAVRLRLEGIDAEHTDGLRQLTLTATASREEFLLKRLRDKLQGMIQSADETGFEILCTAAVRYVE